MPNEAREPGEKIEGTETTGMAANEDDWNVSKKVEQELFYLAAARKNHELDLESSLCQALCNISGHAIAAAPTELVEDKGDQWPPHRIRVQRAPNSSDTRSFSFAHHSAKIRTAYKNLE